MRPRRTDTGVRLRTFDGRAMVATPATRKFGPHKGPVGVTSSCSETRSLNRSKVLTLSAVFRLVSVISVPNGPFLAWPNRTVWRPTSGWGLRSGGRGRVRSHTRRIRSRRGGSSGAVRPASASRSSASVLSAGGAVVAAVAGGDGAVPVVRGSAHSGGGAYARWSCLIICARWASCNSAATAASSLPISVLG